jgi:hypothetical protein
MNLRLLTKPLLATGLLLSTLGCSKKDDPAARLTNIGTYTLDGVVTPCQAQVSVQSGTTNNLIADYLDIKLTPTAPQYSGEAVVLYFEKPLNAPASGYKIVTISYSNRNSALPLPYAVNYTVPDATATLSQLSSGSYSGTFAGTFSRFSNHVITAGSFTDVRP